MIGIIFQFYLISYLFSKCFHILQLLGYNIIQHIIIILISSLSNLTSFDRFHTLEVEGNPAEKTKWTFDKLCKILNMVFTPAIFLGGWGHRVEKGWVLPKVAVVLLNGLIW